MSFADIENGEEEDEAAFQDNCIDPPARVRLNTLDSEREAKQGRAPTMTIEVVRIGRPLKISSLLLALLAFGALIVATCSSNWMQTDTSRMGLFNECFNKDQSEVCLENSCYTFPFFICSILAISSLCLLFIGIVTFISAMLVVDLMVKLRLYDTALSFYVIAAVVYTSCIILHPVHFTLQFSDPEFRADDHIHGEVRNAGWALFLAISGVVVLLFSIILLIADRKGDELVYKEKIVKPTFKNSTPI